MKLIRPYDVLCLLGDLAVLWRKQLRRDRCIQDIQQGSSEYPAAAAALIGGLIVFSSCKLSIAIIIVAILMVKVTFFLLNVML